MDRSHELGITKAYCYFSGTPKLTDNHLDVFVSSFPELSNIPKNELRRIIANNLEEVKDEIDPYIDGIAIFGAINLTKPLLNFWSTISENPIRVSEFETLVESHPVLTSKDKAILRTALKNVYSQDPPPKESPEKEPEATYKQPNISGQEEIESKIKQEALETIVEWMTKEVFNSHLIPQVSIISFKQVKNAYVLGLQFSSPDSRVQVYSDIVVMGKKILPPTEIYDEKGNRVGDFDKASFERVFSPELPTSVNSENYQAMMDELLQTATPVQARQILNTIKSKYGSSLFKEAFDKYVAIRIANNKFDKKNSCFDKIPTTTIIKEEYNENK